MRLIDADVLKQHIDKLPALPDGNFAGNHSALKALINMQPTIEPEQRWIPVSERMPEPRIDVWCNSDMGLMVGYYDEYAETWYGRDYLELIVTAWMPLPPAYHPEDKT